MFRRHPVWTSFTPCIPDLLMAMDFKASVLHVYDLSIALPWIPKNSPQSLICFGDQKAIKTPKLNTIWLELIARVLNMLIGLKGDNYHSKVFIRVDYKLWNNTFWVVIRRPIPSPYSRFSGSKFFLNFPTFFPLATWGISLVTVHMSKNIIKVISQLIPIWIRMSWYWWLKLHGMMN